MISDSITDRLFALSRENKDKEVCGLITIGGDIHTIENVAMEKGTCFLFHKLKYLQLVSTLMKANKDIFCIFHTHPSNISTPSQADREYAARSQYPSLIVTDYELRWVN